MQEGVNFHVKSKNENINIAHLFNRAAFDMRNDGTFGRIPNIGEKLMFSYDFLNIFNKSDVSQHKLQQGLDCKYEITCLIPKFQNEELDDYKIRVLKILGMKSPSKFSYINVFDYLIYEISKKRYKVIDIITKINYYRLTGEYSTVNIYLEEI